MRCGLYRDEAVWAEDETTLPLLRDRATTDTNSAVRQAAVQAMRRMEPAP